jgi:hypothetical protein
MKSLEVSVLTHSIDVSASTQSFWYFSHWITMSQDGRGMHVNIIISFISNFETVKIVSVALYLTIYHYVYVVVNLLVGCPVAVR